MTRFRIAVCALLLSSTAFADDWLMPGLTAQWIAKDMTMNGVPASIREVRGQRSLDEVLTYLPPPVGRPNRRAPRRRRRTLARCTAIVSPACGCATPGPVYTAR